MILRLGLVFPRLPGLPLFGGAVVMVGGVVMVVRLVGDCRLFVVMVVPRFRLMGSGWISIIITSTMFISLMWYFTMTWGVGSKSD